MITHSTKIKPIITAILLWIVAWCATMPLFMNTETIANLIHISDFSLFTKLSIVYVLGCICLALVIFRKQLGTVFPAHRTLWLYTIVAAAVIYRLFFHDTGAVPSYIYVTLIVITVFWQDFLTFGLFQTRLASFVKRYDWVIVAIVFWLGHLVFFLNVPENILSPGNLLIVGAACVFALLRKFTGSMYATNVLHTAFLLVF